MELKSRLVALRPSSFHTPLPGPLLAAALMTLVTFLELGVVALLAMGRLGMINAIILAALPWVILAAAFRPDLLLLGLIAVPASFTTLIPSKALLVLISVALAALMVTRGRPSFGLGTGLATLLIINVAGYMFHAPVGQDAAAINQVTMLSLTYYLLLALLAFNLALIGELDGGSLGAALVLGVASTLAAGLVGYGGAWFESGPGIISRTYLGYMVVAALSVSLAPIMTREFVGTRLGHYLMTGILLCLAALSMTRAVWIAAVITIGMMAFRLGMRRYLLVLLVAIVIALFSQAVRQQVSRSESGDIVAQLRTGEIATGRWELWTELWERAQPALPWGNGFGYIWSLSSEAIFGTPGEFESEESGVVPPHNDFLYLLVEFGLPGAFLLILFWIQLFRAQRILTHSGNPELRRSGWIFLGAIVTGLMVALFDDVFAIRPFAERFFPVVGYMFGLAEIERAGRRHLRESSLQTRSETFVSTPAL